EDRRPVGRHGSRRGVRQGSLPDEAQPGGSGRRRRRRGDAAFHRPTPARRRGAGGRVPVVDEPQPALPTTGPIAAGRLVAAALLLAACARERSAGSAEELLPDAAQGALVTAPLAGVAQNASALLQRAAQLPGGEQLDTWRRTIAAQVGFDPLTREGQLAAGLDPDRAAALVLLPGTTQ